MSNLPTYTISNEHLLLINILNGMYNDNLRQVNSLTQNITALNNSNLQIQNLLIQMLHNPSNTNSNSNNTFRNTNTNSNRNANVNRNSINSNFRSSPRSIFRENNSTRYNELSNTNFSQLLQSFFQPIEIFPTQTQIESSTRRVRYSDIVSPINRSCPISLEQFTDTDMVSIIRYCGHIFNTEQLNTWFRSNCRCPVCRYDIRIYNSNTSSGFFGNTDPIVTTPLSSINQLNDDNDITSESNIERNIQGRTSTTSFINSIFDNIVSNVSNVSDISGNNINNTSDPLSLYLLISELNNRNL